MTTVWNDFGFRGGINDYYQAFEQNGWRRGLEWDMYTTWGPTSAVSNGLGSAGAHGATADQLGDYEAIVYFVGDLEIRDVNRDSFVGAYHDGRVHDTQLHRRRLRDVVRDPPARALSHIVLSPSISAPTPASAAPRRLASMVAGRKTEPKEKPLRPTAESAESMVCS